MFQHGRPRGASVALAAPFLLAAGYSPVQAVTVTLIGHVVGISFGAIGTLVVPQMAVTGLTGPPLHSRGALPFLR